MPLCIAAAHKGAALQIYTTKIVIVKISKPISD